MREIYRVNAFNICIIYIFYVQWPWRIYILNYNNIYSNMSAKVEMRKLAVPCERQPWQWQLVVATLCHHVAMVTVTSIYVITQFCNLSEIHRRLSIYTHLRLGFVMRTACCRFFQLIVLHLLCVCIFKKSVNGWRAGMWCKVLIRSPSEQIALRIHD